MAITGNCIILSIRREHAQRIFEGSKIYELRKALPADKFKRVYLYESGGRGIVGCFEVARVIREDKGHLWDKVKYSATTKTRFDEYFKRYADGYAIEVLKPVCFRNPISAKELREIDPKFHVPMSSVLVKLASPLGQFLERNRRLNRRGESGEVILAPIASSDRKAFQALVLRYVGARYEEIDESFAARTLDVHDSGHDPLGFFTQRKDVFSIWNRKERVGFTTITWKTTDVQKQGRPSSNPGPSIRVLAEQHERQSRKRCVERATGRSIAHAQMMPQT
jgi:predicted transcriptional regulator